MFAFVLPFTNVSVLKPFEALSALYAPREARAEADLRKPASSQSADRNAPKTGANA